MTADPIQRFEYRLFADFHQFYLQDAETDASLAEAWTPEATARLLAVAPGIVGVGTVRNVEVPVAIELLPSPPTDVFERWDRIVECSVDISSGRVLIAGCTDYAPDAAQIAVPPGTYRVRVSYGGLNTISADGLEGDDHYRVQLWRGTAVEPQNLK